MAGICDNGEMDTLADGFGLIEAPVWDDTRGLLFSDVLQGGVHCISPSGELTTVFEHRRGIGGMVPHEAGGLVVSGRNISFKPFDGGDTLTLLEGDPENDVVGFNDITVDAVGRIYAGALGSSPVFDDGRGPVPGDLYLIDLDRTAHVVATDVQLTNGLGFSPDGRTLYHSDSWRQRVFRYDVRDDGSLGNKQTYVHTIRGAPDGLAVSEDGAVWVALAGGSGVAVYEPDGRERAFIEIPLPMCTSLCFGGPDLRDLYIVTGSDGADTDRAGTVFHTSAEVAGLPLGCARVSLP